MRNLPPTKTNLLKMGEELSFASLGHELLDQKRGILVAELLTLVDQASAYEKNLDKSLAQAFGSLEDATLAMGKLKVLSLSGVVNIDAAIAVKTRKVMGVSLPVVNTTFVERAPYYSAMGADFRVDVAVQGFREALGLMGRFAELKVSIMRLASEVRKTIRKVNALEKIAIPDLEETIVHIHNRLEENERDMFALMKTIKNRLSEADGEAYST
jgi:V/A-type H+-transporting ATPase subunit D